MPLSQICDLRAGWGLGSTHWVTSCKFYGPVRSHLSKLASSENMWRGHFLGRFVARGLPGARPLGGKVGPSAGSGRSRAPRAGPGLHPQTGPPGCSSMTLSLLSFSSCRLQQTLPPVFVAQWAPSCTSKDGLGPRAKEEAGMGPANSDHGPPAVQQTSDHLFVF